jgi:hypothetical protein
MFAAPNSSSIMSSVPASQRGAASVATSIRVESTARSAGLVGLRMCRCGCGSAGGGAKCTAGSPN